VGGAKGLEMSYRVRLEGSGSAPTTSLAQKERDPCVLRSHEGIEYYKTRERAAGTGGTAFRPKDGG